MLEIRGGRYRVGVTEHGRLHELECSLRGKIKQGSGPPVAVGDRVELEELDDGEHRISDVLARTSALTRRGVARRREQAIAANVDQVVAVASVARPDPDFTMIDRLLVLAELSGLRGLVVVNKADQVSGASPADHAFAPYRNAGYEVLQTSATHGAGLDALGQRLNGRISVLSGQSGVGKSSLLNALVPGLDLRVGKVGERKGRGRHTTVAATLHPLGQPPDDAGWVCDTPGLQYLSLWNVDPAALSDAFPEIGAASEQCRFADCRHRAEPDCGVRATLGQSVPESRYDSYLTLLEESEASARQF